MILLVDGDPPLTTADWIQERNDNPDRPQINGVQLYGNIRNGLLSLKKRYDYVIVDCGGEGNRAQRSTMLVATEMGDRITTCKMVNPPLKAAVVLVHGNGPQVGLLALQNSTYTKVAPIPWMCWVQSPRA